METLFWVILAISFFVAIISWKKFKSFSCFLIVLSSYIWAVAATPARETAVYGIQIFLCALMLIIVLADSRRIRLDLMSNLILSLIVSALITSLANGNTINGVIRFMMLLIFYTYVQTFDKIQKNSFLYCMVIGFQLALTSQLYSLWTNTDGTKEAATGNVRYGGLMGHPNYAAYLSTFCLLIVFYHREKFGKLAYALLMMDFYIVLNIGARTAFICGVAGLILVLISEKRQATTNTLNFRKRSPVLIVSGLILITAIAGSKVGARISEISNSGGLNGQNSMGWRILQWEVGVNAISSTSFFGNGWQTAGSQLLQGLSAHNMFLQARLELGIPGLLIVTTVLIVILFRCFSTKTAFLIPLLLISSIMDAGILFPSIALAALSWFSLISDKQRIKP